MGNQGNVSTHLSYAKLLTEGGFNVLMFDYQAMEKAQAKRVLCHCLATLAVSPNI